MLEKIKQFFAGIASVTIALYAIGYIAEYAHDRMLGVTMVDPMREEYLISGGTFFQSTFFALYTTLINYWYYYVFFLVAVVAFLYFDRYEQKNNRLGLQAVYTVLIITIIMVYLNTVILVFIRPFGFRDFLLRNFTPILRIGFLAGIEKDLRTWIFNNNHRYMDAFYVLLLFFTAFSAVVTYALVKRWQRGRNPMVQRARRRLVVKTPGKRFKRLHDIPRQVLPVFMVLMGIITAVLIIAIPIDFGVLIKSNTYPEVKVTLASGEEIMPEREPGMESKMWLLRENSGELLLHAVYVEKGKTNPVFKILVLKKEQVNTMEILQKSFILEIKGEMYTKEQGSNFLKRIWEKIWLSLSGFIIRWNPMGWSRPGPP